VRRDDEVANSRLMATLAELRERETTRRRAESPPSMLDHRHRRHEARTYLYDLPRAEKLPGIEVDVEAAAGERPPSPAYLDRTMLASASSVTLSVGRSSA